MPEKPGPGAVSLPVKPLLLVLGVVATAYAAALLVWGDSPRASLAHLWSWTGLQAGLLCLLNYGLRGLRWRLWMAHYGRHFGPLEGLRLYLAGYAFTPTPGNVGEAVRGLMLARNPLGARQSLAIFGAERLADLMCLLMLCLPALWWVLGEGGMARAAPAWLTALLAAGLLVVAVVLVVLFRRRRSLLQRFDWLREAWHCLALRPLVWLALTLLAWAAQGLAVWLICRAFGVSPGPLQATGFYALAMVAGALSALPAGLGGTEAVLAGLLVAYGANPGAALGITVLTRLLTLWLAVAIGMMALLYSAAIRKEISFR
ncbi:MAG: lysylphosphatidylglycerol synthase transmembrane domain-containing protein [Polaromonas sp.]